jgi:hypothetical protein
MATQLENIPVVSDVTPSVVQPPVQELGMKERFYRYFQEEVTGTMYSL